MKAPLAIPVTDRGRWGWPVLTAVLTAAFSAIPILIESQFYQRGDTAAQFAPSWWHFGELVRDGQWPIWLDTSSWAGGNYVAEGLFGTYNPLNILVWLLVSLTPDLLVATYLVKAAVMVMLSLGVYALAREYRAERWAAATVAVALPFSGFALFWDAGSWPSGLMAFAYMPWVWWTFRRALRGVQNPIWAFVAGALAVLHGNPYGTLAVVVVGAAMVLEGAVRRDVRAVARIVAVGACVAALLPLVYMPLLASSDLAVRSGGALFENSGKLRPTLGDLFAISSPLHVPPIRAITGPMQVPATFLAWFVVPLLPWLRWGTLRSRVRELVGLGFIGVVYLLMTLGPSKLWLFRWPLRVIEYFFVPLLVVLAIVLSAGLARTQVRVRLMASAFLVALTAWLSWSQDPATLRRVVAGAFLVGVLTLALLGAHLLLRKPVAVAGVALAGIGVTLAMQIWVIGENESSRVWHVPHNVADLQETFADREGRIMQFADLKPLQNRGEIRKLEQQWDVFLPGSMHHPAGVEAVNNYTGMGFRPFTRYFCMEYDGLTKACGYRKLWRSQGKGRPPLPDLMKLDTIVVQKALALGVTPGEGWRDTSTDPRVHVLERIGELPYSGSELSWASPGVDVADAQTVGALHHRVELAGSDDDGELIFAMLGWPGWSAELDGRPLDVSYSKMGLLTVAIPEGSSGTLELRFRPPGLAVGVGAAAFGLLGAVALGVFHARSRRRGDRAPAPA